MYLNYIKNIFEPIKIYLIQENINFYNRQALNYLNQINFILVRIFFLQIKS